MHFTHYNYHLNIHLSRAKHFLLLANNFLVVDRGYPYKLVATQIPHEGAGTDHIIIIIIIIIIMIIMIIMIINLRPLGRPRRR